MLHEAVGGVRRLCSYLPYFGLIKLPPKRPDGVSVLVRSCNDEWMESSLRSLSDFADEVVVVDASTDDTPAIIRKVAEEEGMKLKLLHLGMPMDSYMGDTETHVYQSNLGLRYANYRWVVVWDGDQIAFTDGPNNILKLKEILLNLDRKKYFHISINFIDLYGDFFHTIRDGIHLRLEAFAFTWSPYLKFRDCGRFERMSFPLHYGRVLIPEIHVVHLATVKQAKYLLYRKYWTDWREKRDFQQFPALQDYVKYRLKTDFDTSSEEEGIKKVFEESASRLIRCDYLLRDCPEMLKDEIKKPRYQILYRNGQIVGRNDIGIII